MDLDETWYPLIFLVADLESELEIAKFKIADPTRQTKMQEFVWFDWVSTKGFLRSLMTNPGSNLRNAKWRIQYGGLTCTK